METQEASGSEQIKPLSLLDRLTNVFAAPGELFENVRLTPKTNSNWLIPLITLIVVTLVLSQLVINNPSLASQTSAVTKKAMEKGIQKSVQEGKMTQEQADQAYENFSNPNSTMAMVLRIVFITLGAPIFFFLGALVYWLLGKWGMGATVPYMKVAEVIGLVLFIGVLQAIVTTLMVFMMDSIFASPSLALLVSGFDFENKLHLALAKINVFALWSLAVTSVGLSKLFQRSFAKVLVLVFALTVLWWAFGIFTGINFG